MRHNGFIKKHYSYLINEAMSNESLTGMFAWMQQKAREDNKNSLNTLSY